MSVKTLALVFALALNISAQAAPKASAPLYRFGPDHSQIGFQITHLVVSKASGIFDTFEGTIRYDAKKPERSSVDVSIDAASINTHNERRDQHLRSPDFFNVAKDPKLTFRSSSVKAGKDGALEVTGKLTMRGVTKTVVLHAVVTEMPKDDAGRHLGFKATARVNRMEYGIAWNRTDQSGTITLGDMVDIDISGDAVAPN